jgi:hypothetical protein
VGSFEAGLAKPKEDSMGTFRTVSVAELRAKRLKPADQAKFNELKGYVEGLEKGQAGVYECDPGEDVGRIRKLLRMVAGVIGIRLRIKVDGPQVVFVPKAEAKVVRRGKGEDEHR